MTILNRWNGRQLGAVAMAAVCVFALDGCATRGGKIPYGGAGLTAPDRPVSAEEQVYDTRLAPLDVLKVNVFRVPELSGEYQLDGKGNLELPLVGVLPARERTPEEVAAEITRAYGKTYLQSPLVTVRVVSTNSANVTVEGGVVQSGIYSLPGKTTLTGIIAMAHGISEDNGNPRRVAIFRKQGGKMFAAAFDLKSIGRGQMTDPVVYPGDTVVVESDTIRKTYRDILQSLSLFALFQRL
jgi:polysaccharide export outer membrane protein